MSTYIKAHVPLIVAPFTGESGKPETYIDGGKGSLFQRYVTWLRQRRTERVLKALSPRIQRDIGYEPMDADPDAEPIFASLFQRKW